MDDMASPAVQLLRTLVSEETRAEIASIFANAEKADTQTDGGATTQQLAAHGAALLQPKPSRRGKAFGQIKRLYNHRNSVMYGRGMGGDADKRRMARRFAAGVFRAVVAHRAHQMRLDQNLKRKDLITELMICH